ncbi:PadR family transcriptional regulator [Caldisericum exile]|uniref:PadR family transcriptional regulator n=1 Tax=Caldisericum exile (strain DSM 21853 / NBRC 104410 / AZM16c01) TaxID=511051 RepID=A0A7U6GFY9_CALEA|nr:PadR family transcriptional regulator [Caldisericum exile]BAL81692.1 putative PadR family transcriptional regulator [Caldisericum exile AZM16c01]
MLENIFRKKGKNLFITSFFGSKEFLYFYILHLLSERDMYGEEISKAILIVSRGTWYPNPGFIYPVLKKLSVSGYIKGDWVIGESKHPRLVYKITEKGKTYYRTLRKDWKEGIKEFIEILRLIDEEGLL